MQRNDAKASLPQFALELRARVTAKMAEVLVNWRIDFRACGNKQTQRAAPGVQESGVPLEFGLVVLDMLQHVDTEHCIAGRARRQIGGSTFQNLVRGELSAVLNAEPTIGLDCQRPRNPGQTQQVLRHLADASADFNHFALKKRPKFSK